MFSGICAAIADETVGRGRLVAAALSRPVVWRILFLLLLLLLFIVVVVGFNDRACVPDASSVCGVSGFVFYAKLTFGLSVCGSPACDNFGNANITVDGHPLRRHC